MEIKQHVHKQPKCLRRNQIRNFLKALRQEKMGTQHTKICRMQQMQFKEGSSQPLGLHQKTRKTPNKQPHFTLQGTRKRTNEDQSLQKEGNKPEQK